MILSKATLRQIIAQAVCQGMIEQIPESFDLAGQDMPPDIRRLVAKARLECGHIRRDILGRAEIRTNPHTGAMLMDLKTYRRYMRAHEKALKLYTGRNGGTMPAAQAVTSAMAIADAMRCQSPDLDRRTRWNLLENLLTEIYAAYDPAMQDADAMLKGVRDAEKLLEVA